MPATFVPPHQLSQDTDFKFSWTGASPGAAVKKERLRSRNAILQSTGFLEAGLKLPASCLMLEDQDHSLLMSSSKVVPLGGLSQALHSTGGEEVQ